MNDVKQIVLITIIKIEFKYLDIIIYNVSIIFLYLLIHVKNQYIQF